MPEKTAQEKLIIGYLLGELSKEEEAQVEEQYFTDASFLELVRAMEETLIDDYVSGNLPKDVHQRVEKLVQSSRYMSEQARLARSWFKTFTQLKQTSGAKESRDLKIRRNQTVLWLAFWKRPHILAASLALLLALSLSVIVTLQRKLDRVQSTLAFHEANQLELQKSLYNNEALEALLREEKARRSQLEDEIAAMTQASIKNERMGKPKESSLATLVLEPVIDAVRSPNYIITEADKIDRSRDKITSLRLAPEASRIRFVFKLQKGSNESYYRIEVINSEGKHIYSNSECKNRGDKLTLILPSSLLPRGTYQLEDQDRNEKEAPLSYPHVQIR